MNTLLIYMIKTALYLIAFYLVYYLLLRRDTAHQRNRAFLVLSVISSLILPLINISIEKPLEIPSVDKLLSDVFIIGNMVPGPGDGNVPEIPVRWIILIYFSGVLILLSKLVIDFTNLIWLIARHKTPGSKIIRFQGFNTSGFSALGYIFINTRLSPEDAGEIINHEKNHLSQNHYLDIIFFQFVIAFQWFNPFIFLIDRELRAIHEFQADRDCLNSGIPVTNYQSLLLSQVFKSRALKLTNSFSNPSLIRKRMLMMTRQRTAQIAILKLLAVPPVAGIVLLVISAYKEVPETLVKEIIAQQPMVFIETKPEKTTVETIIKPSKKRVNTLSNVSAPKPSDNPSKSPDTNNTSKTVSSGDVFEPPEAIALNVVRGLPDPVVAEPVPVILNNDVRVREASPYVVVDEMPKFEGGETALIKYLTENTRYPESAKENNIQGKVILRFCITSDGGIDRINVMKGVSRELDQEAVRVVSALPAFRPGRQGGKAVPVWYMVPITFTLI
jgi:TonB family protein